MDNYRSKGHAEVRWQHVVFGEVGAVVCVMRRNARWGLLSSGDSSEGGGERRRRDEATSPLFEDKVLASNSRLAALLQDAPQSLPGLQNEPLLLSSFANLKARMATVQDLRDLDPIVLLDPFLAVIKSGDTTGPITATALNAVEKFIKYRVLDPNHPSLPHAMSVLTHTVANCKFEATDAVSDEIVLTRILRLIRVTVLSEAGQKTLDDKAICEMVETAFGMCFQGRVSELLKRAAEQTLIVLTQALFERLAQIMKAKEHTDRLRAANHSNHNRKPTPTPTPFTAPSPTPTPDAIVAPMISLADPASGSHHHNHHEPEMISVGGIHDANNSNGELEIKVGGVIAAAGDDEVEDPKPPRTLDENHAVTTTTVSPTAASFDAAAAAESDRQPLLEKQNSVVVQEGEDNAVKSQLPSAAPTEPTAPTTRAESPTLQQSHHRVLTPFGLPAILELIRVLVTLMDPRNRSHTDTAHRLIALTLLNVGVEVGGGSLGKWIGWGYEVEAERKAKGSGAVLTDEEKMAVGVKDLVVNELIKYLFQLLQNTNMTYNSPPTSNNMTLLTLTLRVLSSLFHTSRHYLKFQFEFFLDWIMTKVDTGVVSWDVNDTPKDSSTSTTPGDERTRPSSAASLRSSTTNNSSSTQQQGYSNVAGRNVLVAEVRELLLETMVQCCRIPGFFTELWVNFDGDDGCQGNLYEEVVRFLCKHAFPDATPGGPVTMINHQIQCVDGLMLLLRHISDRKSTIPEPTTPTPNSHDYQEPTPQQLLAVKRRKRLLSESAMRFNANPKDGIRFLQEHALLPAPVADAASVAAYLKTTPDVNKKLIGEYIAKRGNEEILKEFIKLYDFKGKRLDEGLRLLLESFRLPGEAQQIERVVENFAEGYFRAMEDSHDHNLADQSAGFVLAFSIILLNTDQHNPQVRRRMTPEDFQRNNRGCNNGKDFDPEYLRAMYDAIRTNEIVMPEEHEGDLGFGYAWKEVMKRVEGSKRVAMRAPRGEFGRDMFEAVCAPVVAAISYAFDSSEDSLTLQKAVVGFHQCASIANTYHLTDVLDNIIISLSKTTGLLKDYAKLPPERKLDESSLENEGAARVDAWAVEFGRNYKGRVACVLMFHLAAEYGNTVRAGWKNIVEILGNLFLHSFLPVGMLTADNFIRRNAAIPRLVVKQTEPAPKKETSGGGLFFSLTQLLSLGGGDEDFEQPPTGEEVEAERKAIECVALCRVEEMFLETRFLEEASLQYLLSVITQACFAAPKTSHHRSSDESSFFPANRTNSTSSASEKAPLSPTTPTAASTSLPKNPNFSLSIAFYLELIVNITFHNRDRLQVVWPVAFELIVRILGQGGAAVEQPALLERTVVGLLRLLIRMVHKDDMLPQVFESIHLLTTLPADILPIVAEQLMSGLVQLIKTDPTLLVRYPDWDNVVHLLSGTSMHIDASRFSLEAACILVSEGEASALDLERFGDCVDLLLSFATSAGGVIWNAGGGVEAGSPDGRMSPRGSGKSLHVQAATDRALKALEKLFSLNARVPGLVLNAGIGRERIWFEFWLPLLSGFAQQCYNPGREIRQTSLTLLQRCLLSPELETTVMLAKPNPTTGEIDATTTSTLETGVDCFESVLFPLLEQLLKPETDYPAAGMDETRMRVAALLCKIWLQYVNRLVRYKELGAVWMKVLDYMDRYVNAGGSEFVSEGVLESLKNMLLVMSTQKVFQPSASVETGVNGEPAQEVEPNLWGITWQHIDKVYPGLKGELFPGK
ncbi:GDP/GTP exchange factor for ARF [Podochytrium sp. JEL0797]|nr:GDP/GTP exchange factor for ARF [Podochytrium sp. JEL0797]